MSPVIPDLGPLNLSNLFQRRKSKDMLSGSYIKFEVYDNINDYDNEDFASIPTNTIISSYKTIIQQRYHYFIGISTISY